VIPLSRRQLLERTCLGFGSIVLANLLRGAPAATHNTFNARPTHFPARAKAVIQLVQNGGPSQMDLFDPKPALQKYAGQPLPGGVEIHQPNNVNTLLPCPFEFKKYGQSGMDVSEMLPHTAGIVDELCFIRSMHTAHNNHLEGLNMLLTCKIFPGRPVMGAWITYALGTENQNLPAYVVLRDPAGYTIGGKQLWANAYLPALYQGVEFRTQGAPVHHLQPPEPQPAGAQRAALDLLAKMNQAHAAQHPGETELDARIRNFELAARMQLEAGDVLDISKETEATRKLYGLDDPVAGKYGLRCLMARRLVERGVRMVQIYSGGGNFGESWDAHWDLKENHEQHCGETDKPIAGLLADLQSRGLLDSTLVIWHGEFGRLPISQRMSGRDHNPYGFTVWMAGGGTKGGTVVGATDDFGLEAVDKPKKINDLHATILHLMGFDHTRLTYLHNGRFMRLTDVEGELIREIVA